LRSRQKRSLLFVNEYFGGERNTANGTLWTDTIYVWVNVLNATTIIFCLISMSPV